VVTTFVLIFTCKGQRGIEIANRLSAEGRYVIGWDLEWAMDFKANRNQVNLNQKKGLF
jgi:hypothetical protein